MLRSFTLALLLTPAMALAQAPSLVNYQGLLVDADGKPLVTGSYRLEFNVYTAESAGTRTWGPKTYATAAVQDGYFNVILDVDSDGDPFSVALDGPDRWLGIKVENGTELRQQLLSAPYALRADTATRLQGSAWTDYFTSSNPATAKAKDADKLDGIDSAAIFVDPANTSAPKAKLAAQADSASVVGVEGLVGQLSTDQIRSGAITADRLAPITPGTGSSIGSVNLLLQRNGPFIGNIPGSVDVTVTGKRPVFVSFSPGTIAFVDSVRLEVRRQRIDVLEAEQGLGTSNQNGIGSDFIRIPAGCLSQIDFPPAAGTYRYSLFVEDNGTGFFSVTCQMTVMEL
ncbi:hypothetical protein GC173_07100 [bacterium]|nr:hypothetical protein [bacterium]